ncbi:hypothetical protein GQ42DRAFT_109697, partial [Ramicandelaber brevisporus]
PKLTADPVIVRIADKYGVHLANVLLSWHFHRGGSVIPRSVTEANIKNNMKVVAL